VGASFEISLVRALFFCQASVLFAFVVDVVVKSALYKNMKIAPGRVVVG
jgi:hypothetical protein